MTPRARRIEAVFDEALDLAGDARARFLDRACAGDDALRAEVSALLAADTAPLRAADAVAPHRVAALAAFAPTMEAEPGDVATAATDALTPDLAGPSRLRPRAARRADDRAAIGPDRDRDRARASIGHFVVSKKLGEGGMGVVYDAFDARLERRVAVKLVRLASDASRARLLREAQAMARVAHPNVVAIHEVGVEGDEVFVAMELVDGAPLSAWQAEPRTPREIVEVYAAAGRGLAAAHAAGVVHRDFKPDNVLVGRDGRARVVDFGLARAIASPQPDAAATGALADDARTSTSDAAASATKSTSGAALAITADGAIIGTPAFMAPEQFRGEGDAASDQFAFAVALYGALYRKPPFAGETVVELCDAVLAGALVPPPAAPGVPEEVAQALVRALSTERSARFASMNELLQAIERPFVFDAEVDRARGRSKRRIAALVLCVVGGATAFANGRVDALSFTPKGLLGLGLSALVTLLALGLVFRREIAASAYNRRVGVAMVATVTGFCVHRAFAIALGGSVPEILVGDATSVGAVSAFGAATLEPRLALGVPAALFYAVFATLFPDDAAPAFLTYLLLNAAGFIWIWGEQKR